MWSIILLSATLFLNTPVGVIPQTPVTQHVFHVSENVLWGTVYPQMFSAAVNQPVYVDNEYRGLASSTVLYVFPYRPHWVTIGASTFWVCLGPGQTVTLRTAAR